MIKEVKKYHKTNFHKHTFCEFEEVNLDESASLIIHHKSKSGSCYSFTTEGVYRIANHWGRAANCRWRLKSNSNLKVNNNQKRVGYARWIDFYPNNETEPLFYIEMNYDLKLVMFQHKNNPKYDGNAILRNSVETAKVIKQIKELLESDSWAKHYNFKNVDEVRKITIQRLINTTISINKIKMDWQ